MSVKPIVIFPNEVLTTECKLVTEFDTPELKDLIADMFASMYEFHGVGLAANQIGVSKQVAVIDLQRGDPKLVLINPSIIRRQGTYEPMEGCLSVPDIREQRRRAVSVDIYYFDICGEMHELHATWLLAQAIQHECDHLAGRLCLSDFALKRFVDANAASEAITK
jgi:peptide deformylase